LGAINLSKILNALKIGLLDNLGLFALSSAINGTEGLPDNSFRLGQLLVAIEHFNWEIPKRKYG
jgi:hypothetical protein